MNILICGFKGQTNTAKLLLDRIQHDSKLYLENNPAASELQLSKKMAQQNFDAVIMLGQKPRTKHICIEQSGKKNGEVLKTYFDCENLRDYFIKKGFKTKLSNAAGTSVCNNAYYHLLKLKVCAVFVHVPTLKNVENLDLIALAIQGFSNLLEKIKD